MIDFGISYANKSLQAKAAEEAHQNDERTSDALATYDAFYSLTETKDGDKKMPAAVDRLQNQCLVVIRGNFSPVKKKPPNDCEEFRATALQADNTCKWLHDRGIYPSESSDTKGIGIYLEANFKFSKDGTSFRLQPYRFLYQVPIKEAKTDPGSKKPVRYDLVYNIVFESAAAGQTGTPFGVVVLPFQRIEKEEALNPQVLDQRSSGWTPILPVTDAQATQLNSIQASYDSVASLPGQINQRGEEIKTVEAAVRRLLNELSAVPPTPPLATDDAFKDGSDRAKILMSEEIFDDALVKAKLDSDPGTAEVTSGPIETAKRNLVRIRAICDNNAVRAKILELKTASDNGLSLRSAQKKSEKDLASKKSEIEKWTKSTHEFGPFNIRVTLKEKSYAETNQLLLTAADALAASKQDISTFLSQQLVQGLGLQSQEEKVTKLAEQAQLQIAAKSAYVTVQNAQAALLALPSDTPETTRREAALTFENAKINANIAYIKAGLPPQFPDSFGGDFH